MVQSNNFNPSFCIAYLHLPSFSMVILLVIAYKSCELHGPIFSSCGTSFTMRRRTATRATMNLLKYRWLTRSLRQPCYGDWPIQTQEDLCNFVGESGFMAKGCMGRSGWAEACPDQPICDTYVSIALYVILGQPAKHLSINKSSRACSACQARDRTGPGPWA